MTLSSASVSHLTLTLAKRPQPQSLGSLQCGSGSADTVPNVITVNRR